LFLAWAALAVLIFPSVVNAQDISDEQIATEWAELSNSDTRRVFNFGIGSLMSWSSRQHTQNSSFPTTPDLIYPSYPTKAVGIRRSFNLCWRYIPVTSSACQGRDCPLVVGASFEVTKETYPELRRREASYEFLQVEPELPLPEEIDPEGYMFAWATLEALDEPLCTLDNIPSFIESSINTNVYPAVSQAYWGESI